VGGLSRSCACAVKRVCCAVCYPLAGRRRRARRGGGNTRATRPSTRAGCNAYQARLAEPRSVPARRTPCLAPGKARETRERRLASIEDGVRTVRECRSPAGGNRSPARLATSRHLRRPGHLWRRLAARFDVGLRRKVGRLPQHSPRTAKINLDGARHVGRRSLDGQCDVGLVSRAFQLRILDPRPAPCGVRCS
jgi:hypothetical protein